MQLKPFNNMKKLFLLIAFCYITIGHSFAQKFAWIDSEYILNAVPEYKTAQSTLDALSVQWQKEVETKYTEIDRMYKSYQAEQVLLSEEMKRKREEDIIAKEKEAKELQKQHFGVDGDLFKKRQELVKPIQDKIYNAVKEFSEKGQYAVIFDKSSDLTMIYSNSKYDKSDEILSLMGYKKTTATKESENKGK